jgi:hypothetical protein
VARFYARPPSVSFARRPRLLSHGARSNGSTEFQVNSSNRFSAQAEVAHANAGHALPWQREARFRPATAEQSFVLSTRPAVGFELPTISSSTRARRLSGVAASVARY